MNHSDQEAQLLESIVPKLEAEGYTVYVHPSRTILPPFMRNYVPDLVALGDPKNLAVEIVREGVAADTKLKRLQDSFRESKDWELRVYFVRPTNGDADLGVVSKAEIEDSMRSLEKAASDGQSHAALLIAWATFEALGRALLPERFKRPQTPGRLIEVLASAGHITPTEAETLRRLADVRNHFIHGNLNITVDVDELSGFIGVLKTLLGMLK